MRWNLRLAEATGITTPLLVWLQTARREATARRLLQRAWRELDDPDSVPVATAAAELLNPIAAHPSPADEVWLPLDNHGTTPVRRGLHQLLAVWPHVLPPVTDPNDEQGDADSLALMAPAPAPMPPAQPPATSRGPSAGRR